MICISPNLSQEQARHLSGKSLCNARRQISNRVRPVRDAVRIARHFSAGGMISHKNMSPVGTIEIQTSVVPTGLIPIVFVHPGTEVPGYSHHVPDGT